MEQCDKVILFGYLDGYTYELNGITNYVVALETGERVEIPVGGVISVDEFVKKDKIKLKDVIARIKKLDLGTQKVWLNEILNELGSDYGTLKYKAGYEQGKVEGALIHCEEPQKITVPQFIADWIKYCKFTNVNLGRALFISDIDFYNYANQKDYKKLKEFLKVKENQEIFARAWINGYEVEKEKRYTVKMRATKQPLFYNNMYEKIFFSLGDLATRFTRKELEESGFGWVFDCEGMEVEEVEE